MLQPGSKPQGSKAAAKKKPSAAKVASTGSISRSKPPKQQSQKQTPTHSRQAQSKGRQGQSFQPSSKAAASQRRPTPLTERSSALTHRYTWSAQHAERWLQPLLKLASTSQTPVLVGFDTETPVKWHIGPDGRHSCRSDLAVALVQLCYHHPSSAAPHCLLLQVSGLGFTQQLVELLEHPNIIKVGAGVAEDVHLLQRGYTPAAACQPQGFVDLSWLAYACGVVKPTSPQQQAAQNAKAARGIKTFPRREQWSLSGLLQHTTGYEMEKKRRLQMSDWSRIPLTHAQQEYAAADAVASLVCTAALQAIWQQQQQRERQQQQGQQQLQQQALRRPASAVAAPDSPLWMLGAYMLSQAYPQPGAPGHTCPVHTGNVQQPAAWQEILARGCSVTASQLQQMNSNAMFKAEAGEEEWLLGVYSDPVWASARSGCIEGPNEHR